MYFRSVARISLIVLELVPSAISADSDGRRTTPRPPQVPQAPHGEDEIYVVVAGAGAIELDGATHPLRPGSMVSVPRDVEHRFVDITEDLVLAVVFGPPEGSGG